MKIKFNLFYFISLLLLALNLGLVVHFYRLKTSYHDDEIFSYGHANSTTGAFLVKGIDSNFDFESLDKLLFNQWIDGTVIHNYLTVQPQDKFKYKHIFENLAVGVHPPLFYIMLHTICSFTPDKFSKWSGAALNIPLWIVLLIMMFKLSGRFFKDKYLALLPVVFYAYSQIGFNTVLYIRGYLMQTLWAVCLIYETICLLQEKDVNKKRWFLIFLYSLLGMLTQYNAIIYSAIIGIVTGSVLLWQKRYKHLVALAGVMILSLCSLFIIFPEAINVLLYSSRSKEIAEISLLSRLINFLDPSSEPTKNLSSVYTTDLWSFRTFNTSLLWEFLILVLAYKYLYTEADKKIDLLVLIYISVCLYAKFFMPEMYIYNMRYIMFVMPIIAIATIWYLAFVLQNLKIKDTCIKLILSLIIIANTLFVDFSNRSPYAFQIDTSLTDLFIGKKVIWQEAIYNNFYISEKAKAVFYSYEKKITDKYFQAELDKSDYFVKFSRYTPDGTKKSVILPEKIKEKMEYLYSTNVGVWFYDIYRVNHSNTSKKQIPTTKEMTNE